MHMHAIAAGLGAPARLSLVIDPFTDSGAFMLANPVNGGQP
jgi:hypothetical protein